MQLFDHQLRFLKRNPSKCLLVHGTGTGKTLTSIEWAKLRFVARILVVVPKALKENWRRNIELYHPNNKHRWTVMSKEEFRKDWDDLGIYDTIIVDEAHHFSGRNSQMSKNLGKFIRKWNIKNILLATATPYLSTPWNIFTLAHHLGYQWNWWDFKARFFVDRYIGRRAVPVVRPGIEEEIAALVASIGDVVRLDECVDVPEQVFESEVFEETPAQVKAKKELMEINPIVRFTKYHQIEAGAVKGDEYVPDSIVPSNKTERIISLCEENKKIIIVCRYNLQIDMLKKELEAVVKKPIFVIRGDVKDRDSVVREAEASDEAIVILNASCSEGYELPSFPLMVFASLSFSFKDYRQICGRILRINKLKRNTYLHLISGQIDKAVYDSIMKKQDFDITIYAKNQLQGEGLSN